MLYNINPQAWGPAFWQTMHYISVAYPDNPTKEDKESIKMFYENIKNILPCEKCRVHFVEELKKYPLTDNILASRYNLINWVKDLHNYANQWGNKKQWTYEDIINKYYNLYEEQSYNVEIITIILLVIIVCIIIVYMKYFRET